jgi:CheY-like chemotaxis protein
LAESIDGKVTVRSTLGKGSVFKLEIPAAEAKENARVDPLASLPGREKNALKGMKIAVLDDDKVLLNSIAQVLRSESACVTCAATQAELTALIAADPLGYHAIVTDWNLRVGTGENAVNELKRIPGFDPAWIVISGDISAEDEARIAANGIPVIHKPFHPETLIAQLANISSAIA